MGHFSYLQYIAFTSLQGEPAMHVHMLTKWSFVNQCVEILPSGNHLMLPSSGSHLVALFFLSGCCWRPQLSIASWQCKCCVMHFAKAGSSTTNWCGPMGNTHHMSQLAVFPPLECLSPYHASLPTSWSHITPVCMGQLFLLSRTP